MFNMHFVPAHDKLSLDGKWKPVYQELGGTKLPEETFKKQMLTISDSTYALVAESVDKGVLKYGNGKMDIFGRDGVNKGKHFMTIYKVEAERLTICYNLAGDSYPETFSTSGHLAYFLSVFVKAE